MIYRIMIVEDDEVISSATAKHIEKWGFDVHTVEDFFNVKKEFDEFSPHLVLIDLMLPFYNGYHWCQEIRKTSNVPIIVISSASDSMNMVLAMNMGADDFIAKPFNLEVLCAKIQAVLRILQTLMQADGIVSRDTLMEKLWETDSFIDENTLSVNVARLRKKLDSAGLVGFIVTKKGLGYELA